jgi:Family of unknown function (DUF6683)
MFSVVRPTQRPAAAIAIRRSGGNAVRGVIGAKPARRVRAVVILSALACLCSTAAFGQWSGRATASFGRGLGSIALSQGNLALGRAVLREHAAARPTNARPPANARQPASLTPDQIEAALAYTPDPQLTEKIRLAMIDNVSAGNPESRPTWEKAFADDAVLREFESFMSAHGYSSRNFADDIGALLWVSWEIVTGSTASEAQIRGAHAQARGVVLGNAQLRTMSDPQRQAMAEPIAYQVMIFSAAKAEAVRTGDQAGLAKLRENVAAAARQFGLDVSRMRLTDKGFRKT